jgi:hypothetical protein
MLFSLKSAWKGTLLPALNGNNPGKMYNFGIKLKKKGK